MTALSPDYTQRLEDIKAAIQESELLSAYIDSEEADDYNAFKEAYEPEIAALYEEVAANNPLELEALEIAMLDTALEGLYLPKVLGYAVLRPRINERGQYFRPQDHLREVMLGIAKSAAFPELERRIGQAVTVAFAASTNVWITKLVAEISNKTPRNFFLNHNDNSIRTPEQRLMVYNRYRRQFAKENYATASFPENAAEAAVSFPDLEKFLRYRFGHGLDNSSLAESVKSMLNNKELQQTQDFERFISLISMFMDVPTPMENGLREQIRGFVSDQGFEERYFEFLSDLHKDPEVPVTPDVDRRMALRVGVSGKSLVSQYYALVVKIHDNGINNLETQDAIRVFTNEQDGLSAVNECVRQTILRYFIDELNSLNSERYTEFFELTKLFATYFEIFGNESFKQEIREKSTSYLKSLLKKYTDKRGRDYQDIKKFVQTTFVDLGFMSDKEVANFFKSKRKRVPTES